jgi:hypothetical protein
MAMRGQRRHSCASGEWALYIYKRLNIMMFA